ncbi:MAG TPA: hypothetical protein VFA54_07320 [Bryobacterales bacterium]|jgi:hypothetical protein|nr:hypothetical protein [Bryobacterales bacterium]
MSRVLPAGVLLAALSASIAGAQTHVAVFMAFDEKPSPVSVAEMKAETARILRSAGLLLDWRPLSQRLAAEAFGGLAVMRFKGACRADKFQAPFGPLERESETEPVTLGWTAVRDGRVLPFSEVECDQIRNTLGPMRLAQKDLMLGRALGRVVAHELYHIVAETARHGRAGVAKPFHTPDDLRRDGASFEEEDRAAIFRQRGPVPPLLR